MKVAIVGAGKLGYRVAAALLGGDYAIAFYRSLPASSAKNSVLY